LKIKFENNLQFAKQLDKADNLRAFRSKFSIPRKNGKNSIYFTGNSLGLAPRLARRFVNQEITDWTLKAVEGHHHALRPWLYYHKFSRKVLAEIVGAKPSEVIAMNSLTVNLHLMMVSFYRPTRQRYKIIIEAGAFSSDQYAVESQIKFHGLNPKDTLIELAPREGEFTLRTPDIIQAIEKAGNSLALIIFGGVQYYTGQFFDIKSITEAGHKAGAYVAFDLAHATGNVDLHLHKQNVDFAVWCSYKYLNSGPGGIAGLFVHEKHFGKPEIPRFAGWWGHDEKERFQMKKGFKPQPGADGWQLSNVPIFQAAAHLASLEIFEQAGMKALRKKSILLTGFLEFLLKEIDPRGNLFTIITPSSQEERGCQLSIMIHHDGNRVYSSLIKKGVSVDWREPGVIRLAPVPLYNTFEDVYTFAVILKRILH
jgi:kynureninase